MPHSSIYKVYYLKQDLEAQSWGLAIVETTVTVNIEMEREIHVLGREEAQVLGFLCSVFLNFFFPLKERQFVLLKIWLTFISFFLGGGGRKRFFLINFLYFKYFQCEKLCELKSYNASSQKVEKSQKLCFYSIYK